MSRYVALSRESVFPIALCSLTVVCSKVKKVTFSPNPMIFVAFSLLVLVTFNDSLSNGMELVVKKPTASVAF